MRLADLKPGSKRLVYDVVTEAGIDTSDWANFKGKNPSTNPKYCYDWAFWDDSKKTVALCLWHTLMEEENGIIFQKLNYREVARKVTGSRVDRARSMDQALYMAFRRQLPVRVIIVDGTRRDEHGADFSRVARRMLDSAIWRVANYDEETGECRIERTATGTATRTFLLTWSNFEETPESEIEGISESLESKAAVNGQWSSGNRHDIKVGEEVFLLRQGSESPGLVGRGIVSRGSFPDEHWDQEKREHGTEAWYVMVDWREMTPARGGLVRSELLHRGVSESLVNARSSGVAILGEDLKIVRELWDRFVPNRRAGRNVEGENPNRKLARIAFNSGGWKKPTGDAGELESGETYNARNKFGHEDWLFRDEWVIDGWRYAFIQGMNKSRKAYLGESLNVTLYTLQPDRRRRLVATINGLEALGDQQARDAVDVFRAKGWLKTMQDEVKAIGGTAEALGNPEWAEHVLNVRFRLANVDAYSPETFLPDDEWIRDRHRYMLYKLEPSDLERIERYAPGRRGSQEAPKIHKLFRRGVKPVEYTPEHDRMQARLMAELQQEYGKDHVWREQDFVDLRVETENELIYFEIKTDLDPRVVIRHALGQIIEYAYHPARAGRRPDKLVIVGRTELGEQEVTYLSDLCERFSLPVCYRVVSI